jgi:adenylate cyclase
MAPPVSRWSSRIGWLMHFPGRHLGRHLGRYLVSHHVATGLVLVLILALWTGLTIAQAPVLASLQLRLLDTQHRWLANAWPQQPEREVVVVGIDDETLRALPEPLALWHPHLSRFMQAMATARPAAVGLDIVLPERSFDAVVPGYDRQLMQGLLVLRASQSLVMTLTLDAEGRLRSIYPPFVAVAGRESLAHVLLPLDVDQVPRRAAGAVVTPQGAIPSLAAAMAARVAMTDAGPTGAGSADASPGGASPAGAGWSDASARKGYVKEGDIPEGHINYALGPQPSYIPLREVLAWHAAGDAQRLRAAFEGKPVLLGIVLPLEDRYYQPINLAAWESGNAQRVPGVLIHAQILRSMLNGGLITELSAYGLALLCAALALAWLVRARLAVVLTVTVLAWGALYLQSTLLLRQGLYLPVLPLMLTLTVALLGRWLVEALFQLRERARLRGAFSGYVSPAVMEEILQGRLDPALGGKVDRICVMFADVRGFTTFSETMPPAQVIALLNRYFDLVMTVIHAEGGTINSIMGDGLMAIFGAPKTLDHPCDRAFAAARGMIAAVETLNAQLRAEGKSEIAIGIGLHYGEAVIGHVGSAARHDYSAIGDTVNLASRVEGLTRAIEHPLACTDAVLRELSDASGLVSAGLQSVKGRSPVLVHGWRPAAVPALTP